MNASYASTGAAGVDYEVDLAVALFIRLLAGGGERALPDGFRAERVSLQHRAGPLGFDDVVVAGQDADGEEAKVFLQSKRSYSLGDTEDFRELAKAVWTYDQRDTGKWWATIAAGEIKPDLKDIDELVESAHSQPTASAFGAVWGAKGAMNGPKRTFLGAVREALKEEVDEAVWRVLRRLRVLVVDYDLATSRDRRHSIDALATLLPPDGQDPAAVFGALRDLALRQGKLAGSFSRAELLSALAPTWRLLPGAAARRDVGSLETTGRQALESIDAALRALDGGSAVSLMRTDIIAEASTALASDRRVRIVGEGGSGKSAILKRLATRFSGPVLVLKDDRVQETSWDAYAANHGIGLNAAKVALEFATRGPCLLAIDGADRMLLSSRKGVVTDLLREIAASPLRGNWSIITSARDFQTRDLAAAALDEAGLETGRRVVVAGVDQEDVTILAAAMPGLATLVGRSDLGDRNRILFLMREILASPHARMPYTEVTLAAAWAIRGEAAVPPDPRRDRALAQLGDLLLTRPERRPGRADLDPNGLRSLVEEETLNPDPTRDALALAHDVHEDWVLSRAFERHSKRLPALLRNADQPLWWLRAIRILGQTLLESDSGVAEWRNLIAALDAEKDLDPAWSRSLIVAPLYSERSTEILRSIEGTLLADEAYLLERMIETLLVYECRLDERMLRSKALADLSEIERLRTVASWRIPQWRSWANFLRWSTRHWSEWPPRVVLLLSRVACTWNVATEGQDLALSKRVVEVSLPLLREIEDARHPERWEDRRNPFGVEKASELDWDAIEKDLRNAVIRGVSSAGGLVEPYLERLTANRRLRDARTNLIEHPGLVPSRIPRAYVDLTIKHFVPRRRRMRRDDLIGYLGCFGSAGYNDAGIENDHGFFPPAPDRAGFADLFAADETEALRLFHRLEMRASVYLRNFWRWHDRRRARPALVPTAWGKISLWGDENVYRWSRGILGPHVLGSAYLALDDWIVRQADDGRPIEELSRLVLQPNGLVSTVAPLIGALALHVNNREQIDAAAPFLATPRLWAYDIRRYQDDQSHEHAMGWMRRDRFYDGAERVAQRYHKRRFLRDELLLPFQLTSSASAREELQEQRADWVAADLAAFEDELTNPAIAAEHELRIERLRSNADLSSIKLEPDAEAKGIIVSVAPPEHERAQIDRATEAQRRMAGATKLTNWIMKSRQLLAADSSITIAEAIALADELEAIPDLDGVDALLWFNMRAGAIVGVASIAARFGNNEELDRHLDWVAARVVAGCTVRRDPEDEAMLFDDALLFNDPQLYGAEGLVALINRGLSTQTDDRLAIELATHRLSDVAATIVGGLDWTTVPEFAWNAAVAALDTCVMYAVRPWINGDEQRAFVANVRLRRRASHAGFLRGLRRHRRPVAPRPPYETRWMRTKSWAAPFKRVRIQARWLFEWNRAGRILKNIDLNALARYPAKRQIFEAYLAALIRWTQAYSEEATADRYRNQFPFEWGRELATTLGRLAAMTGSAGLWKSFLVFQYRDRAADLVGDYLEAVTAELMKDGRVPDDQFWSAWRPAAEWIMGSDSGGLRRIQYDLTDPVAAAGFVGPYLTPIPPDWPYVETILPTVDSWGELTAGSERAAYLLLRFAERLDVGQRERWLVAWVARLVEENKGNPRFWSEGALGDLAAGLLAPLEKSVEATRREVRRLLAIIADAGSLGAREVLAGFATGRTRYD